MNVLLATLSLWLHTLATIVMVGHYLLLALAYLPALRRTVDTQSLPAVLASVSVSIRTWMLAALLVFAGTGVYLVLVNDAYHGLGQFTNAWSMLMLVKHLLVLVMIVLGFRFNSGIRPGAALPAGFDRQLAVVTLCGLLVLLLTAFAQAQ
jgi:uncharacterized membrane protein